jgi:hypothetical protein
MDTLGSVSLSSTNQHTAAHKVFVTHSVEFSPTSLSVVREIKQIIVAVSITIATVVAVRSFTSIWSSYRDEKR